MIELLPVDRENLKWYDAFDRVYDVCLKEYMSRIRPDQAEQFEVFTAAGLLRWNYILFEKKPVGAVWLERKSSEAKTVKLGIFIAEKSCRGRHIGEDVIGLVCESGRKELDVDSIDLNVRPTNVRAIRCYRKCGFEEINRFVKPNGVEVIRMRKKL